ncbi:hypothetical protein NKH18_06835 [Streptomyces sp. M10(2022)]
MPRFPAQAAQAQGELVEQFPDGGAFGAGEGASHAGASGLEVVLAGREGLAEDDLFPFVEEELGAPALLVVFEEDFAQYVQGPVFGDQAALRAGRGVLGEDVLCELVDVFDVDAAEQCRVHE